MTKHIANRAILELEFDMVETYLHQDVLEKPPQKSI